jgi:hypothetical protein
MKVITDERQRDLANTKDKFINEFDEKINEGHGNIRFVNAA